MAAEKNFWNTVKKNLPKGCFSTRIENRHGGGVPDVHLVWSGLVFWIELKVSKGNTVRLSSEQIAWNTAYSRSGGLSFILVKDPRDGSLFLFGGAQAALVAKQGLRACALYHGSSFEELWAGLRSACEPASCNEREEA